MAGKDYPKIGSDSQLPRPKGATFPRCCVCGAQAKHKVWIELNWFRGDDDGPHRICSTKAHTASDILATNLPPPPKDAP